MKRVVVPISDTSESEWALNHVIELHRHEPLVVHLLNVQAPLSSHITRFFSSGEVRDFHRDNGLLALKPAAEMLDRAGVPHDDHVVVGQRAETIVRFAKEHGCQQIVIGKHRPDGLFSNLGLGSIGSQIRNLIGAGDACDICEVV